MHLPGNTWLLGAPQTNQSAPGRKLALRKDRGCVFVPRLPLVVCGFTMDELLEDDYLKLKATHELGHFDECWLLLPLLLGLGAELSATAELATLMARLRRRSGTLVADDVPRELGFVWIEKLVDWTEAARGNSSGIAADLPPVGLRSMLEGLDLHYVLAMGWAHGVGERWMREAFGSSLLRAGPNREHWEGLNYIGRILDSVAQRCGDGMRALRLVVGALNLVPWAGGEQVRDEIIEAGRPLAADSPGVGERHRRKCVALRRLAVWSLLCLEKLARDPDWWEEVDQQDQTGWLLVLHALHTSFKSWAPDEVPDGAPLLGQVALDLGPILMGLFGLSAVGPVRTESAQELRDQFRARLRPGGYWPPIIYRDGQWSSGVPAARPRPLAGEDVLVATRGSTAVNLADFSNTHAAWTAFGFASAVRRWLCAGGALVCPFYRFCTEVLCADDAAVLLAGFCDGAAAQESLCRLAAPELVPAALRERGCPFWLTVTESLKCFERVVTRGAAAPQ